MDTVDLMGMEFARLREEELHAHILAEFEAGRGGWVVTANLDFLRRKVHDPEAGKIYDKADLRVADGMPIVWASKLLGQPLPERIAGSSITLPLCHRAARAGRSIYLMGGEPEANDAAAARLEREVPGLRIAGRCTPSIALPPGKEELRELREDLLRTQPDLVFVAFGSPKQEHVIEALRDSLPRAWWIGIGISLSFMAGHVKRAPRVLQVLGLEWVHRLAQEPRRLARRYLLEDLPFAFRLLAHVLRRRLGGG